MFWAMLVYAVGMYSHIRTGVLCTTLTLLVIAVVLGIIGLVSVKPENSTLTEEYKNYQKKIKANAYKSLKISIALWVAFLFVPPPKILIGMVAAYEISNNAPKLVEFLKDIASTGE